MCDAGELPPVGSEFIHQNKKVKCISTSDEQGGVVTFLVDELNIECCWNNDSWVRAITPPIKLEDGKAYQFTDVTITCGVFSSRDDCFHNIDGLICPEDCTNIQELEVKS